VNCRSGGASCSGLKEEWAKAPTLRPGLAKNDSPSLFVEYLLIFFKKQAGRQASYSEISRKDIYPAPSYRRHLSVSSLLLLLLLLNIFLDSAPREKETAIAG
jgi:hypothetical protein